MGAFGLVVGHVGWEGGWSLRLLPGVAVCPAPSLPMSCPWFSAGGGREMAAPQPRLWFCLPVCVGSFAERFLACEHNVGRGLQAKTEQHTAIPSLPRALGGPGPCKTLSPTGRQARGFLPTVSGLLRPSTASLSGETRGAARSPLAAPRGRQAWLLLQVPRENCCYLVNLRALDLLTYSSRWYRIISDKIFKIFI